MSFSKYPKNWKANGYGWHNFAAMGYCQPPSSTETSSGVSSMHPSSSTTDGNIGFKLSYGFLPQIQSNQTPSPASSNRPESGIYPTLGWAVSPDDSASIGDSTDLVRAEQEIPCQSIFVPAEELPHYSPIYLGDRSSGLSHPGDIQDFHALRDECLRNGVLFEDPEFPANNSSLLFSRRPDRHIEWMRPREIADDAQFFVEGYSRFDVQQGELGDCWLLAATASLTQDPKLFFRVVPADQNFEEDYAGIFHFCFWQYGRWVDVVIDDRLPTYRGELVYMNSAEKNEFWSALLEKAYAKLHGSYEALKGGTTCEAMEDFTGGVTEMYELNEAPPNLFNILMKAHERNSMMGCSIEPDPHVLEAEMAEGLIKGHAYSITKVQLMDIVTPNTAGKIPMLRLRNPWGNDAEWNGPWSDKSPEWRFIPEHTKMEIGLTFDADGEFWMSFNDWMKHFNRVEMCNLSPDSLSDELAESGKKRWEMSVFEGEWTRGVTAGGCRNYLDSFWHNPQYVVHLVDPDEDDDEGHCTVIIGLMQKNRRSKRNEGMDCLTIGFAVYRLNERDLAQKPLKMNFFKYNASVARSPAFINLREVSCRFKLPPGNYLIVPSTFEPNEEGEFLIRVFSENKNIMEENDQEIGIGDIDDRIHHNIGPAPSHPTASIDKSALEKLFIDVAGDDMEINWIELKRILDHALRDEFSVNGLQCAQVQQSQSMAISDGGGGGGESGSESICGSLLTAFCSAFCKDNQLAESLGLTQQTTNNNTVADINQQIQPLTPQPPITNQIISDPSQGFSKECCRSIVALLDTNQSGKLGFEEFKILLDDIIRWKAVFRLYDKDHSGNLNAFELREALDSAGYKLNNKILNALYQRYSSNDGTIPFEDFVLCALKVKTMMDVFKEHDVNNSNTASISLDDWLTKAIYS